MIARMQEGLRQLTIIGEQHQSFTIKVQAANREHPHGHAMKKVLHGVSPTGIVQRRHDVLGFVQHQIHKRLCRGQVLPIHFHVIEGRIDLRAKFRDDLAVHRYSAGRDQHLSLSAGREPRARDEFL
jgi:hypothetical protein